MENHLPEPDIERCVVSFMKILMKKKERSFISCALNHMMNGNDSKEQYE
jgi:hypothetical protein